MNGPTLCSVRAEHRTVLRSALEQRPVPRSLKPAIVELDGFGFVERVHGLGDWLWVTLTLAGQVFARRDCSMRWWELWTEVANRYTDRSVSASTPEERRRCGRRSRAARARASVAFTRAHPFARGAA